MEIKTIETTHQIQNEQIGTADIIQIEEYIEGSFRRQEKIQWQSAKQAIESISDQFPKAHDFHRWQQMIRSTKREGYSFAKVTLDQNSFDQFYCFYVEQISPKKSPNIFLKADWLDEVTAKNRLPLSYVCIKDGELAGGLIGFFDAVTRKIHASYLAVDHTSGGITAGLQELLLNDYFEYDCVSISYGKDRNFYGIYANPGLIYNKSKFGLTVAKIRSLPVYSTLILRKDDPQDWMFFCPISDDIKPQFDLHIISDDFRDSVKKYDSSNVRDVIVHKSEDVIKRHGILLKTLLASES